MNQILVTQRLYVTPELRRKKKLYRLSFILSIILIIVLSGMYIYGEYSRNTENGLAGDILGNMSYDEEDILFSEENYLRVDENALLVSLDQDSSQDEENLNLTLLGEGDKNMISSGKYTASNGKEYSIIGIVEIPKIDVKYPIIEETSDALLKVSICKFWGPNANEAGNLCLVGHNYKNSRFFSKVPKSIGIGDIVKVTDLNGVTVEYKAYDKYTVDPTNTKCTTQLTGGRREVTVITCTDDTKQRVVVKCREVK